MIFALNATWWLPILALVLIGVVAVVGAAICIVLLKRRKVEDEEVAAAEVAVDEEPVGEPELVKEEDPAPVVEAETAEPVVEPEPIKEEGAAPVAEAEIVEPVKAVVEPVKEEEPAPVAEAEIVEPVREVAKPAPIIVRRAAPEGKVFVKVRYNRSYTAKLIQSDDTVKNYYTEIKNELMRYKLSNRVSWRYETFRRGRKLLVKLALRGKSLYVYFALDPADYADTKYKIDDVSHVATNAGVPTLYKIKNDRRCRYAKQLIADVMAANELEAGAEQSENYAAQYPYEELEPLVERGLVKLLKWEEASTDAEVGVIAVPIEELPENAVEAEEEIAATVVEPEPEPEPEPVGVSVAEAEERISDEEAENLVEVSRKRSDKTKKAVVNIDTLGRYFESGERVTLDEMKKRIPEIGKKVTYIKVLARGTLHKALTVEADDFSPAAIKMIVLTDGKVIRNAAQ